MPRFLIPPLLLAPLVCAGSALSCSEERAPSPAAGAAPAPAATDAPSTSGPPLVGDEGGGADPLPPADPAITRDAIERHVRFLASDEMRGRRPGSPELARVRDYLVRNLERDGVRPAGDDGTYRQRIPLALWHHEKAPELVLYTTDGEEIYAVFGVDFDVKLAGFGPPVSRGRLTLRTVRSAEDLPAEAPRDEVIWIPAAGEEAKSWLAARGLRARDWPVQLHLRSPLPGPVKGPPEATLEFDDPETDPGVWLSLRAEVREVVSSGRLAALELRFFTTKEEREDFNIVGIIDGESPRSLRETVVLSAHVDGYGVLPGFDPDLVQGRDLIRNSADDNASGVAALLEVAEALAAEKPASRAVVVLFTALGTQRHKGGRWYAEHPAVPLENTILNLHLDTLGRPDDRFGKPGRLWVAGSERTNLQAAWFALDLQVAEDMRPRANYFQTRGSWVFASRHIPAHTLTSYGDHGEIYSFKDDPDRIDFDHLTAVARTCFLATKSVLDRTVDPAWR